VPICPAARADCWCATTRARKPTGWYPHRPGSGLAGRRTPRPRAAGRRGAGPVQGARAKTLQRVFYDPRPIQRPCSTSGRPATNSRLWRTQDRPAQARPWNPQGTPQGNRSLCQGTEPPAPTTFQGRSQTEGPHRSPAAIPTPTQTTSAGKARTARRDPGHSVAPRVQAAIPKWTMAENLGADLPPGHPQLHHHERIGAEQRPAGIEGTREVAFEGPEVPPIHI
jgi:hypothetical protein